MKGWAVSSGEYSDYSVLAIFTDIEKAKLYCYAHSSRYCEPFIEEMEIDPDIEGNGDDMLYCRDVRVFGVGNRYMSGIKCVSQHPCYVKKDVPPVERIRDGWYRVASHRYLDDERAEKILYDYLAKEQKAREEEQ